MPENLTRLAVLLSGSGRTLQNILDRIRADDIPARVALVIADRPDIAGIDKAKAAGIPVQLIRRKEHASRESFSAAIFSAVREADCQLVCMAGFLQLIAIPDDFLNRVMNIHPALLPAFGGTGMYGHKVHDAVLEFGAKVTGCTVHFADNQYDHGPIILQRVVDVLEGDTADSLADRVFAAECHAYPEAIRLFSIGALHIDGRLVRVQH